MSVMITIPEDLDTSPSWFMNFVKSLENDLNEIDKKEELDEESLRTFFIDKWKENGANVILTNDHAGEEHFDGIEFETEQQYTFFIMKWA